MLGAGKKIKVGAYGGFGGAYTRMIGKDSGLVSFEAALLLESHVGQHFDAIVTGRSDSNTWVRVFAPPVEGKLDGHLPELDIGQRVQVKLVATDVERGFIDFALLG